MRIPVDAVKAVGKLGEDFQLAFPVALFLHVIIGGLCMDHPIGLKLISMNLPALQIFRILLI